MMEPGLVFRGFTKWIRIKVNTFDSIPKLSDISLQKDLCLKSKRRSVTKT